MFFITSNKVKQSVIRTCYSRNNPLHVSKEHSALRQLVFQSYWLLVFLTRQTLTQHRKKLKKLMVKTLWTNIHRPNHLITLVLGIDQKVLGIFDKNNESSDHWGLHFIITSSLFLPLTAKSNEVLSPRQEKQRVERSSSAKLCRICRIYHNNIGKPGTLYDYRGSHLSYLSKPLHLLGTNRYYQIYLI